MFKAALLGREITYTRSPQIHAQIAKAVGTEIEFVIADVTRDGFGATVDRLLNSCDGFFVTKPYKKEIVRYLNAEGNSANVVRSRDRAVFDTDGIGCIRALDRNFDGWRSRVSAVLILGGGGAAYSVARAIVGLSKKVFVLNRTLIHAAKLCSAVGAELYCNQPAELVINCTSVGQNGEDVLKSLCVLPKFDYAFDLIYTPSETPFLRRCAASGAKTANGTDMLIYQAIEGDKLLLEQDFDVEQVFAQVIKGLNDR